MLKAVLTSDFHLSTDPKRPVSVIPAMKWQPEILDAFFAHVKVLAPDVLILLGDNTNSGRYADLIRLKKYLSPLKKEGTQIIMIPGNHDFDIGSEADYERLFFPLFEPCEKDPASLSFAKRFDDILFLAMDDHEDFRSPSGVLKPDTMTWLEKQLETADRENLRTVFLSHHSLIADGWQPRKEFYCLQPDTVLPLLHKHHVRLAFCGHQHDAAVYKDRDLYETAVPMIFEGTHQYGLLSIDQTKAEYFLKEMTFSPELAAAVSETDRIAYESKKAVFAKLLADGNEDISDMLAALMAFEAAHGASLLASHRQRIKSMKGYEAAMKVLKDNAYGRWIRCLMEENRPPQNRISIPF